MAILDQRKLYSITDIGDLLRLQLEDPNVAETFAMSYSENDGIISHPSHGELWKKLSSYDISRGLFPLCLNV